jgi:MFS family permease
VGVKFGGLVVSAVRLRIPDLSLLGFFGGFFAVPLNALIQHRPRPEQKGGVIAAANLLSFVGVFLAAGAYYLFSTVFHQTPAGVFLDGAILTLVTTAASIFLLRDSLFSFFRKSEAISPD